MGGRLEGLEFYFYADLEFYTLLYRFCEDTETDASGEGVKG